MTDEQFFARMRAATFKNDTTALALLQKENPNLFNKHILDIKNGRLKPASKAAYKPRNKSEQRQDAYMDKVDQKRKGGLNR